MLYFSYGSNMCEDQMKYRCPESVIAGRVELDGFRFAIDARGFATILPDSGSQIEGLVWEISENDLASLDRYEGVRSGCYRREHLQIPGYRTAEPVLVYLSNSPEGKRPQPGYLERIVEAAKDHGFRPEYVQKLESCLPGRR